MGQQQSSSTGNAVENLRKNKQPSNMKNRIVPETNIEKNKNIKSEINVKRQNFVDTDVDNGYTQKEEREKINLGLNNHQYFKSLPSNVANVKDYVGVDSKLDPRFQQNLDSLYNSELNNRDFDIKNTDRLVYNENVMPVSSQQYVNDDNVNVIRQDSVMYNNSQNNEYVSDITISREDALIIRDIKNFTNLDKRLLIMNSITIRELDPINVINTTPNITLDALSSKYISLRNIYHPDKGGSSEMFNLVNLALKKQLFIIKSRSIDKDFNELKSGFNQYDIKKKKPLKFSDEDGLDPDGFSSEKFNKFFDENRFGDDFNNNGYGDMMEEGGRREDIEIEKSINKYNNNDFNNIFTKNKDIVCDKIVEYMVPEAMNTTSNYKILGKNETNFTDNSNNIKYCDYRDAYTKENIISIGKVNNKVYASLEEIKRERKNDKLTLSDEMQRIIEKDNDRIDKEEKNRQSAQDAFDKNLEVHYNRINKYMINNST